MNLGLLSRIPLATLQSTLKAPRESLSENLYLSASYSPYLMPSLIYPFCYQKVETSEIYLLLHVVLHLYSRNTGSKTFVFVGLDFVDSVPLISFFGGSDSFDNDF